MSKITKEVNKYCIYRHTCPSGKVYIGQTKKKPQDRWAHGKGYISSPKFYNSILKYGWDNILHEILYTQLSKSEADTIEKLLIKKYKQLGLSLNITDGGEGVSGIQVSKETRKKMSEDRKGKYCGPNSPSYGRKPSEETRKKMSIAATGRHLSEETKLKVSLNNGRGMLGKHPTEEILRKQSESHKGIKQSQETRAKKSAAMKGKNSKPVLLYTREGEFISRFISVIACAKFIGITSGAVSVALKNGRVINKKYIAIYGDTKLNKETTI